LSRESKQVVRRAEALLVAIESLRSRLAGYESAVPDFITRIKSGERVDEAIQGVGAATIRSEITEAIDAFETTRREFRTAALALGLEQGLSASEVARAFGFSRQLASRLASELEDT
jgi:hypothetical protein